MAWEFSTEPEFQAELDWMRTFVREEIWPLETLVGELSQEDLDHIYAPLQASCATTRRRPAWYPASTSPHGARRHGGASPACSTP